MNGQPRLAGTADATDAGFGDLVAEITDKLQAGQTVNVEEYVAQHPEWAERLRALLPALEAMARLGRSAGQGSDGLERHGAEALQGTLGDYRIVREVGRGGMGVVYEAEQLS